MGVFPADIEPHTLEMAILDLVTGFLVLDDEAAASALLDALEQAAMMGGAVELQRIRGSMTQRRGGE